MARPAKAPAAPLTWTRAPHSALPTSPRVGGVEPTTVYTAPGGRVCAFRAGAEPFAFEAVAAAGHNVAPAEFERVVGAYCAALLDRADDAALLA